MRAPVPSIWALRPSETAVSLEKGIKFTKFALSSQCHLQAGLKATKWSPSELRTAPRWTRRAPEEARGLDFGSHSTHNFGHFQVLFPAVRPRAAEPVINKLGKSQRGSGIN